MKRTGILFLLITVSFFYKTAYAQDGAHYKKPPKVIEDILTANPTPGVSIDEKGDWMLLTESGLYPNVEELARPELRIAGLRINPANYSRSRQRFTNNFYLKNIASGQTVNITGLPSPLYAGNFRWSPNDKKIAFTNTTPERVDLYVVDIATRKATKANKTALNVITEDFIWFDNNTILYQATVKPATSAPARPLTPLGPSIQENYGKASPRPTYQDLIKTPFDERLFEFFTTTQLIKNTNGAEVKIGTPAIYSSVSISPDKKYILKRVISKPFSYLVPYSGFPTQVSITDMNGKVVKNLANLPSSETAPSGNDNVQNVARSFSWRADEAATITWCMPLDSGMIKKEVTHRDAVYALKAPFTGKETELFRTTMRYRNTNWGNANLALVNEGLRSKQLTQTNLYNPSTGNMEVLQTRNTTDAYSNPGFPLTAPNSFGRDVLLLTKEGNTLLFNNTTGSSPKGDLPFLLSFNLKTKAADTLWKCAEGTYEMVVRVLDPEKLTLVTRRESKTEMPNYWLKNLKLRIADQPLTQFKNPYPQMDGVSKEKIRYQRADGVSLTGDLHLPKGYDPKKDGPLPTLIWAYPAEYNSADDAAQVRGSENRFTLFNYGSPLFYVTQGYAVLNSAEMPIVAGSKDKKPNDDFVKQLVMNAEAAIKKLSEMGVGDSTRMAVGGHSYGAFMTAHLLSHTNLFKAGIARSGAYNRSLTPFGFQNEDRTYWQAPELYFDMSPFSYAHKIKTPILLIHGEADNNTGTYPMQSERYFNAIKGHGGTVRYVSLPFESHGYSGRENILHMLAEQFEWLEKYVKAPK